MVNSSIDFTNHFLKIDKHVERIKMPLYLVSLAVLHIIYLFIFLGLLKFESATVVYLNLFIQIIICIFLIIKFNPFRSHILRPNDGIIIFTAALFLLESIGINHYIGFIGKVLETKVPIVHSVHTWLNSIYHAFTGKVADKLHNNPIANNYEKMKNVVEKEAGPFFIPPVKYIARGVL